MDAEQNTHDEIRPDLIDRITATRAFLPVLILMIGAIGFMTIAAVATGLWGWRWVVSAVVVGIAWGVYTRPPTRK